MTLERTSEPIARRRPPDGDGDGHSMAVVVWAGLGLLWLVVCAAALGGWVTSETDFAPAPILGPQEFPAHRLVALRALEGLSVSVLALIVWFLVVRPLRAGRGFGLDAFLILGGLCGFVADAMLNLYTYLFAWNAHSVNHGVWTASLPFHTKGSSSRYAESLLWGLPMYVYFCAGLGAVGVVVYRGVRGRFPGLSTTGALAVVWIADFAFDFVLENLIIRTTEAYAFARTQGSLTLWGGSQFQFPIYESVLVACVSLAFTRLRLSAQDSSDGFSSIEKGADHLPPRLRGPVRALAAVGFCAVVLIGMYHLPFNWFGVGGSSVANLPSYLLPG